MPARHKMAYPAFHIGPISLGGTKSKSVLQNLLLVWIYFKKKHFPYLFQKAKQKTVEMSGASNVEQMLAENAEQEESVSHMFKNEIMDKATKLKNGGGWVVKDIVSAKAAEFAITSNHPNIIIFIRHDDGKSTLKPSMLSSILANATQKTRVYLHCFDSFFEGGEKGEDWREFLFVCLNNDK